MSRFKTRGGGAQIRQSGLKLATAGALRGNAEGLLLRGVVVNTYTVENEQHPFAGQNPKAVYCDVLTYSTHPNPSLRYLKLTGCIVQQPYGGLFDGALWEPRAASGDIGGGSFDPNSGTRAENMNGDHVIVQFIDGNSNLPIITGSCPHPNLQPTGQVNNARKQITDIDGVDQGTLGRVCQIRHNGVVHGVDASGSYIVDTRESTIGDYDGINEPGDGVGKIDIRLKEGARLDIEINGATLRVENTEGDTTMTIGDGAVGVAIGDNLESYLKSVIDSYLKVHTHPTALGPSGPPIEAPLFDSTLAIPANITSTKVTLPDE